MARESKSFSSRSNSGGRRIRTSYGDVVPKAIHTVKQSLVDGIKKVFPKSTVDKELFEIDADTFYKAAQESNVMMKKFGIGNIIVISLTIIVFVIALFEKGFTHEILLEIGVLLVSVKLIMMNNKIALGNKALIKEMHDIKSAMDELKGGNNQSHLNKK